MGAVDTSGEVDKLRNDMIRNFSLQGLEKWVDKLSTVKVQDLTPQLEKDNLNGIQVMSIKMQQHIGETCGKVSELLKVMQLKSDEIAAIKKKLQELKTPVIKKLPKTKEIQQTESKLKKEMKGAKNKVNQIMEEVNKKMNNVIKVAAVFDSKFAKEHKEDIKNLITAINLKLKSDMSLKWFMPAYKKFITHVLSVIKHTPGRLKKAQEEARKLINEKWEEYKSEAQAEFDKKNNTQGKQVKAANAKVAVQNKVSQNKSKEIKEINKMEKKLSKEAKKITKPTKKPTKPSKVQKPNKPSIKTPKESKSLQKAFRVADEMQKKFR